MRTEDVEEPDDGRKTRASRREWFLLAVCMMLCAALLILVYYIAVSSIGPCPDGSYVPVVNNLRAHPTSEGYEIRVEGVSMVVPLSHYKVDVLKDGASWTGFPEELMDTTANLTYSRGPAGEWLNFTDSDHDYGLDYPDRFTLENLESGSEYELVLRWAESNERIADVTVSAP